MYSNSREGMVAKCGLDCSICELYLSKDNPDLFKFLVDQGIPKEKLPCLGCNANQGKCPVLNNVCDTYKCAKEKDVRYCFECYDFPCSKLQPLAQGASKYPHNLKIYNLSVIKGYGIDYFLDKSQNIKESYFKSSFEIGKGSK